MIIIPMNINSNNNNIIYKRTVNPIRKVINKKTSKSIIIAMEKVISHGTAENMNLKGYKIAGKTGTAQKYIGNSYSTNKFISSFASIFPSNDPDFVIIISIDSPYYGYHWSNESAVPTVREIIKRIIINDEKQNYNNSIILSKNNIENIIQTISNYNE